MMDRQIEQTIRERAYEIWLEAGRMHGLALEHWAKAEHDVAVTRDAVSPKPASLKPAAGASATKPAIAKVAKPKAKTVSTKPAAERSKITKSTKASPEAAKSPRRTKAATAEVRGTLN